MMSAKHVVRSFASANFVALLLVPLLLRADATIRYKTEMKPRLPVPGMDWISVIYMKGYKGARVSGGQTIVADFAKNEITVIDKERKKYVTILAPEYERRMAEMIPKVEAGSKFLDARVTRCESNKTSHKEVIQGIQAEEIVQTCSVSMKVPENMPEAAAAIASMGIKVVTHIWCASPAERHRVPGLWQLSGYELWQKYFVNPTQTVNEMTGGMAITMEDLQKDQSAILQLTMDMYTKTNFVQGFAALPSEPAMTISQEVVELSTAPLDDSLFQVPADCAPTTFGDLTNGLRQAMKTPRRQSSQPGPTNVKAYVPSLKPLPGSEPESAAYEAQGSVELLITVSPNGTVDDAEVLSGPEPLRQSAITAVKARTYRPVLRAGAPVAAYTTASVYFIDPKKPGAAGFSMSAQKAEASERVARIAEVFPRSPQQVLADLEQDSTGGDKERRYYALSDLEHFALATGADDKAAAYANEWLSGARENPEDWSYGNAVHDGHVTLGLVALRRDDIATARRELLEAAQTPGSPQLNSFGPDMTLANELLKHGEREAVLEYLTLCRKFWKVGGSRLDSWSDAIRKGETPVFGGNLKLH